MMILPLTNNPEEKFSVTIDDIVYNMRQLWNTKGFWAIDILDDNGDALVYGVKIVTQTNLLDQYVDVPFNLRSESVADPTRDNLDEFNLSIIDKDV